ncbi:MAG: TolC family protein [Bacteroidota bacterium]|nr:TolC family protein [Bacteroidota bacterium]
MRKLVYLLIFSFLSTFLFAQKTDTLNLQKCYEFAENNFSLSATEELYKKTNELNIQKANATYLPQFDLNAKATYQSEVTSIDLSGLPFPIDIDAPSQDQYQATFDLSQIIYDGGITKKMKELHNVNMNIDIQKLNIEKFKLKEKINNLFFSILLLNENLELINLLKKDLDEKIKVIESGIKNGVLIASDVYVLQAEIIKVEQNEIEIKSKLKNLRDALSEITSLEITENTVFEEKNTKNNFLQNENYEITKRPEKELFNLQKQKINAGIEVIKSKKNPKLFAFGQLGYGKPGLNFLSNEFGEFYFVGVKMNWNIWDWKQNKYEQEIMKLNKDVLDCKEKNFDKNIKIALDYQTNDIEKFEKLILKDKDIIELKEKVKKVASSKLKNGTITSSEYLTELNAEIQAKLKLAIHKVQLEQARINFMMIKGVL